jgi:ABC-2 type transport system permease protein
MKWFFLDTFVMIERNLLRYIRLPQLLIFSTIQPVIFLLLFTYVFGGAINLHGINYINYLLPGIFIQTVLFGAIQTGVGLADDLTKGLIERFNSLPMSRSALLAGRTISDMLRNVFVLLLMSLVGYIIGFRFYGGFEGAMTAFGLALLFGFAFSWVAATIGLLVKNAETAQVAGFIWVFPLVFASSVFVPIASMPAGLQTFAKASPITVTVNAVRALTNGGVYTPDIWYALGWIAAILIVFVPLAIRLYRRSS